MVPDLEIKIKKLHPNAVIPKYETDGAACFDITIVEDIALGHLEMGFGKTGLAMEIPVGYELQVRPRSSLGKMRVVIPNPPGTIDSDYRGEVMVELLNLSGNNIRFTAGQRIAQGKIAPVIQAAFTETEELSETERGDSGFGSTGTH